MIRLSVTDLDSYLYWKSSEDMEFETLLMRLRGEEPPSPNMLAGRAFHTLLENASACELYAAEQDGLRFDFAIEEEIALPTIRELKAEYELDTPSGPVTLVGKVDGMEGITIIDYKLTERFDAERYADSYQWRCYLMMFGAKRFRYEVFECKFDPARVYIHNYHRFPLSAYPRMADDVYREVCGLAEIVAKHVPQKITDDLPLNLGPRKGPIRVGGRA